MTRGKFVIVVGPSGSGKNTLIETVYATYPDIVRPVSCTTRAMRPGEQEGHMYHFVSEEEFTRRIDANEFLEWAQYGGHRYGTLKSEILPIIEAGKIAMRDVEIQGARQIKQILPADELTAIYIDAGSWEELERRIRARAPITEEELAKRKKRYEDEVMFKQDADFVIENPEGGLEKAKQDIDDVIASLRKSIGLS
jgi:guanylate kinase